MKKLFLGIAVISLSGCAGPMTAERAAKQSDYLLCSSKMYLQPDENVNNEVKKRNLDCTAIIAAGGGGSGSTYRPTHTSCSGGGGIVNCSTY